MIIAVVVTDATIGAASESIRMAMAVFPGCRCEVLDSDGSYVPQGDETVHSSIEAGIHVDLLRLTHDDATLVPALTAVWAARLLEDGEPVLGVVPGVMLMSSPQGWTDDPFVTVAVARSARPDPNRGVEGSLLANELFLLGTGAVAHQADVLSLATDWRTAGRWLDLFLARVPHRVVIDDAVLVSSANTDASTQLGAEGGRLVRAGRPVVALDLIGLDPARPWVFDARAGRDSGLLLSRNSELEQVVRDHAVRERSAAASAPVERVDDVVMHLARVEAAAHGNLDAAAADLDAWVLELVPADHRAPLARYLSGVWMCRPDLRSTFPGVPGRDVVALATWALEHGVHESGYDAALLRRAATRTLEAQQPRGPRKRARPRGVNLVGYLSGALGIGTSARLMDEALHAAGIPTSTFAAHADLQSRSTVEYRRSDETRYDTSLLAVNADQMPAVTASMADVIADSYRIGMWYWEVETFPASRDGAFGYVDEVWAATDFVRDAIAARATVPVRTVMPPLPQRTAVHPPPLPGRLGIPENRPWFFFAFDYLSTVERKNPGGLLEAFERAFPVPRDDGPLLVIKTINAHRRLADAERLRLEVARRSDVLLIDEHLGSAELTALMARCTAYVSLHRAEGLGLTIAEAMAWGRPVVVTAYSGNMQFTNASNAFLVPCCRLPIPSDAQPYPAGTMWGDPDLDAAADILRRIVEDEASASIVGARAAADIRSLHSPEAAGARVREALEATRRMRRSRTFTRHRLKPRALWHRLRAR